MKIEDFINQPNGAYEVETDKCNVYVAVNGCYYMLIRAAYDMLMAIRPLEPAALVTLKQGGYTIDGIKRLREEGLL